MDHKTVLTAQLLQNVNAILRLTLHVYAEVSPVKERPAMTKRVAILQPNYIPWRGYFDLMAQVDEFIIYDDTQYTRRDWRNRNKIMIGQQARWLSIPVDATGKYDQLIRDVRIANPKWQKQHLESLRHAYGKAPHFSEMMDLLALGYESQCYRWLVDADVAFLALIKDYLGLTARISFASDYHVEGRKTDKLVALCQAAGGSSYLSGPAAKTYIQPERFEDAGLALDYISYPQYPSYAHVSTYAQAISIVDALAHCGRAVSTHFQQPSARAAA